MKSFILIICSMSFLFCCSEIRTNDPVNAYQNWAGSKPPLGVKVINGQYWESSHWTKEYILYLELIAPEEWSEEFIRSNKLTESHSGQSFIPSDAPDWFAPSSNFRSYVSDAETVFFVNTKNNSTVSDQLP